MLSLDLGKKASAEQKDKFYTHLRDSGWMEIVKVTTTWFTTFKEAASDPDITAEVKKDVAAAAKYSGISAYDAVVNFSHSKPCTFSVELRGR